MDNEVEKLIEKYSDSIAEAEALLAKIRSEIKLFSDRKDFMRAKISTVRYNDLYKVVYNWKQMCLELSSIFKKDKLNPVELFEDGVVIEIKY